MKTFKCYAKHKKFGYEAPYNIVLASRKEDALATFAQMTRLADFKDEYSLFAFEIIR